MHRNNTRAKGFTHITFVEQFLHLALNLFSFFGVGPVWRTVGQGGPGNKVNLVLNPTDWWQPRWHLLWKNACILLQKVSDCRRQRRRYLLKWKQSLFANQSIANNSTSINLIQVRFGCKETWPFQLSLIFVIVDRFGVLLFVPFKFICHNLIFTLSMLLILDLTSSSKFIF